MKTVTKLGLLSMAALIIQGCDDGDTVEITQTEVVEVPVIVQVPAGGTDNIQVGSRPYFLIDDMDEGALKSRLQQCSEGPFYRTDFSIGHRGAPLQYPEHTKESYEAAARMGAGILECDVTFTNDQHLVCRHSQCDLHTTTDILAHPEIANKCSVPFTPGDPDNEVMAQVECCTSDITLTEFKQLQGKMDAANQYATTTEEYMAGTANWRTDLYASRGTLMTHAESIELFQQLGVKMTPELKSPSVEMPFNGMTQENYAQKMIDEYIDAGVEPENVYAQSFNLNDVRYWIANTPDFGTQAVYLDGRYAETFDPQDPNTWQPGMEELVAEEVKIIAPPLWVLLALNANGDIVPSEYAVKAREAGLQIITWTLERSGPLASGGGWYYMSIADSINNDGDQMKVLDVLAKDVGVIGIFSDWPGTVSYYASCMELAPST